MRLGFAILILGVLAGPVCAQREADTGTRFTKPRPAAIPDNPALSDAERGRRALEQFAGCLVESDRQGALSVLRSYDLKKMNRFATTNDCLRSGSLRFDDSLLRGALFGELYRRDYASTPPQLLEPPIKFAELMPSWGQSRVGLLEFADCLARADLPDARTFVVARAGSPEDLKAFEALRAHIGPCVPQGQQVKLSKTAIEAALAEVMYQQAPGAAPASVESQ